MFLLAFIFAHLNSSIISQIHHTHTNKYTQDTEHSPCVVDVEHSQQASINKTIPAHIPKVQTSPRPRKQTPHPRPIKKARLFPATQQLLSVTRFLTGVWQAPSQGAREGAPVNRGHYEEFHGGWCGGEMVGRHLPNPRYISKVLCRVEDYFRQVPQIQVGIGHYESKCGVGV